MTGSTLTLVISTPLDVIFRADDVYSVRAEDESGGFGILPRHVPMLAVLPACVLRWRRKTGDWSFCALRGGVLKVEGGKEIRVACRQGVLGSDLSTLERGVQEHLEAEDEAARAARVEQARMHVRAIRQIMLHISDGGGMDMDAAIDGLMQ
ncbi:F0F1 ATP synthase subunit epsilon [Defluviimonas sp. SAOS-178_SWC]|uniref:F0F1 ATP synthase subunit epsilon n=1 Tax=Defluviimonas sp. SAOS-178_SWC TaxID=3121287 RepID=UPI003221D53D